jgi:hypothetical protein
MRKMRIGLTGLLTMLVVACTADLVTGTQPPSTIPGLTAQLEAPASARSGDSITLRMVLRNETASPVALPAMSPGNEAFDLIMRTAEGKTVWRHLAGQYISGVGQSRVVQPGETVTYEASWNGRGADGVPLRPGSYIVTGRLVDSLDKAVISTRDVTITVSE